MSWQPVDSSLHTLLQLSEIHDVKLQWRIAFLVCVRMGVKFYEGVSISFRTGRLDRELQMAQLSATKCSCVILWVSLMSFAAITLCFVS
jgi:hypothetical protein